MGCVVSYTPSGTRSEVTSAVTVRLLSPSDGWFSGAYVPPVKQIKVSWKHRNSLRVSFLRCTSIGAFVKFTSRGNVTLHEDQPLYFHSAAQRNALRGIRTRSPIV
jgi:hypothetical protein